MIKTFLEIIAEALTMKQATDIFIRHGVNPTSLDNGELKNARWTLVKKLHPDAGGDVEEMKQVNSAYDTLIKGDRKAANASTRSSNTYSADLSQPPINPYTREKNRAFENLRHVEAYFSNKAILAGKFGIRNFNVMSFDGRFFRGSFTVPGTTNDWNEMAEAMEVWDRFNKCTAVFIADPDGQPFVYLVKLGDNYFGDRGEAIPYESFNKNPSNDPHMADRCRDIFSKIYPGWSNF